MLNYAALLIIAAPAEPAKCDAKPFTLAKPAAVKVVAQPAPVKPAPKKTESVKPKCNYPGHKH
jgi:hypothetical protein